MNPQISIISEVSRTVRAQLGGVTANVTINNGKIANVNNGQVVGDDGTQLATFNKYEGAQLNVEFYTNDYATTLTAIENFINAVNE